MEFIEESISKTRFKVLFNNLLLKSKNYVRVKKKYINGSFYKVELISNHILNKLNNAI